MPETGRGPKLFQISNIKGIKLDIWHVVNTVFVSSRPFLRSSYWCDLVVYSRLSNVWIPRYMEYYMRVAISLVLVIVHQAHGAYPLEDDVFQIVGEHSEKRWLVFMDIRIWRCMRLVNPTHQSHHDLLDFQRCFVETEKNPGNCYQLLYNQRTIFRNSFGYKATWNHYSNCLPGCPVTLKISVHRLFHVNLTLTHFILDRYPYIQASRRCDAVSWTFTVISRDHSYVYCGRRYPWSMYLNSDNINIKLPHCMDAMPPNDVQAEFGIIDQQLVSDRREPHPMRFVKWSNLEIQTYRISVDMLYKTFISLAASMHQLPMFLVYNGPNPNMPKLQPNKRFSNKTCYVSSTFQVLVLVLYRRNSPIEMAYESISDKEPETLTPKKMLFLRNNTGCGNDDVKSWMCILSITAPLSTYARLKITKLTITGPYEKVWESAGVAVYTVMGNRTVLVAHLFETTNEYATVTGTTSQLLVSVYGYSPFALLSVTFTTEISHCVGQFVHFYKQPCVEELLNHYKTSTDIRSRCEGSLYKSFNVSYQCVTFQNTISPHEYFGRDDFRLLIHFDYESQLKVDYYSNTEWCSHLRLSGKYQYIRGAKRDQSYNAIGDIHYIFFYTNYGFCGHKDITVVTVAETLCLHPCVDVNIPILRPDGMLARCDMCQYFWIEWSKHPVWYKSVPNRTVTIERVEGNLPATISVSSQIDLVAGGHVISHVVSRFTYFLRYKRMIRVQIQDGEVWRVHKDVLSRVDNVESTGATGVFPEQTFGMRTFRRTSYEYIITQSIPVHTAYDIWCGLHGASLLTINDNKELLFVVESIMHPHSIEHVFIKTKRPVSHIR